LHREVPPLRHSAPREAKGSKRLTSVSRERVKGMGDQPPQQVPTGDLPLVTDLVKEHQAVLDAVRRRPEVASILQPQHDDLFILRYVLSFRGDVVKVATAIKQAIEWRRDNAAVLARIDELQMEVRQIIPTGMLPWRTSQGQPIQVAIPFAVDSKVWSTKSEQWHHEAGISNREVAYRICDQLTRESGRLVKMVMIQDLTGLSLGFAMANSKLMQNQGKLSKLSEFLFPQLVATVVITHPPSFVSTLYKMVGAVVSERLMKKMKLAESTDKLCQVLSRSFRAVLVAPGSQTLLLGQSPRQAAFVVPC